jgi:uncharacterized protein
MKFCCGYDPDSTRGIRRGSYTGISWRKLRIRFISSFVLACIPLLADPPRPIVDAAPDAFVPVPLDQQHLAGLLASRLRANVEGYLEHVDTKALLRPYREGFGKDGNSAQAAGLFLVAAANSYEYTDDLRLKSVMDRAAKDLIATQRADGYLGAEGDEKELTAQAESLNGLLTYARITGDDDAFAAARRLADALAAESDKRRAGVKVAAKTSEQGIAARLLAPMIDVYRSTGDGRYLRLCKYLAGQKTENDGAGAGYEALLHAAGLVDLHRLTGDDTYLSSALATWQDTRKAHLSIAGTPDRSPSQVEIDNGGCLTLGWMQLTLELLRATGERQYAEQLERTTYNYLLAAQDPRSGRIDACAPLNGTKKFEATTSMCAVAESVALSEIPAGLWGRYGNGITLFSYSPGRATVRLRRHGTVELYAEGDYPESGNILLHVEPTHNVHFPLRLRIPEWAGQFSAEAGSSRQTGKPGDFVTITREWRKGDVVKISMDVAVRAIENPLTSGGIAIERGPQLLALAAARNSQLTNLAGASIDAGSVHQLKRIGGEQRLPVDTLGQAYEIQGEYEGKAQPLLLIPYADALSYRVWLKRRTTQ